MMLAAFVFPPLLGWLGMIAEDKGIVSMSTAWALTSLLMIILFTSFVWQSADSLGHSEEALKESEFRSRSLSNSIPQLAWTADAAGNIDWYNQRWYDYTGTTFEEMQGWGWQKVHQPVALPGVIKRWQKALESAENWEDVFQLRGRDGSWRWFLSRALPIRNDQGQIVRWFGSNTDIDDQRKAEKQLVESEHKYATLTGAIPQLVWTCRADGFCTYLSRQWVDYTGIPESEQLGLNWLPIVIHPDDREKTYAHWMGAVEGKHPYDIEYRIKRFDGEYRWFTARGTPMRDGSNQISFWVGTCTDIHNQKLVTEELSEAKLVAERANQAKSHFLANMSHEIRTPIGAITGFTELLKNSSSSESDKQNYTMIIERNSRHLLRLIDDILDLSKVEAGKIAFENINFSLPDLLADFDSVMSLRAAEKGIDFRLMAISLIPSEVCNDQLRLRQILANIVGNAIKFTERGSVEVTLTYQTELLKILVRDTGPGISNEGRRKLFQPFSQADPSFTRKFGGSGLPRTRIPYGALQSYVRL